MSFLSLVGYALLAVAAFLLWRGSASLSARLVSLGLLGIILWGMLDERTGMGPELFRRYKESGFELRVKGECLGCSEGSSGGVWFIQGRRVDGSVLLRAERAVAYKVTWSRGGLRVDGRPQPGGCFSQRLEPRGVADLRFEDALQVRLEVGQDPACD